MRICNYYNFNQRKLFSHPDITKTWQKQQKRPVLEIFQNGTINSASVTKTDEVNLSNGNSMISTNFDQSTKSSTYRTLPHQASAPPKVE